MTGLKNLYSCRLDPLSKIMYLHTKINCNNVGALHTLKEICSNNILLT